MAKSIALVFMVLFGIFSYTHAAAYYTPTAVVEVTEQKDITLDTQYEFTAAVAEIFFNGFVKVVQSKFNVLLYVKKVLLLCIVRVMFYIKNFVANNTDFVTQIINLVAELLKTMIRNQPYFVVPKLIQTVIQDFSYPN